MSSPDPALNAKVGGTFFGHFNKLTPVQEKCIGPILSGLDTLIISGTASGKTAAALAPLAQRYLMGLPQGEGCAVLYIVPTKALANDLFVRVRPPLEALGIKVRIRHGDASFSSGLDETSILITTPESFDVMFSGDPNFFRGVKALVVDEAHLLYNTQRGFQLASLIRRLELAVGRNIHIVALSATMKRPKELWRFLRPHASDESQVIYAEDSRKIEAVIRLLNTEQELVEVLNRLARTGKCKVLFFVNSRRTADRIGDLIRQSAFSDTVYVHHSSLSQDLRVRTEEEFAKYPRAVCVATSTLELGIDIGDIDLIVLFGTPSGWESFLQRIGRGNRRNDQLKVLCLVPPDDPSPYRTALLFLSLFFMVQKGELPQADCMDIYGAIVQQVFSVLRERKGAYTRFADLAEIFSPWMHISRQLLEAIADELVAKGYCRHHGFQNRIGSDEGFHRLEDMRLLWGNYPIRSREVSLRYKRREIGSVPASNLVKLRRGIAFRFAGKVWKVTKSTPTCIDVELGGSLVDPIELQYAGKGPGIDSSVLWALYEMLSTGQTSQMARGYGLRDELVGPCAALEEIIKRGQIVYFFDGGWYHYLTFAGSLLNEVICRWAKFRYFEVDDLWIRTNDSLSFSSLPSDKEDLFIHALAASGKSGVQSMFQTLLPREMQLTELMEPWKKLPFFPHTLQRLSSSSLVEVNAEGFRVLSSLA